MICGIVGNGPVMEPIEADGSGEGKHKFVLKLLLHCINLAGLA